MSVKGLNDSPGDYQVIVDTLQEMDASLQGNATNRWLGLIMWMYEGVDFTLPGNGGLDCVYFLGLKQRIAESACATLFAMFVMWFAYPRLTLPNIAYKNLRDNQIGKRLLLVLMCLTFGIELGFKFATRQFIWIFNPCHMATMLQLQMETEVYYIQHILMLVVPFYLLKTGGAYIPEDILDFTWGFTSLGILYIYHFVPLQIVAYFSAVNLNNMLCPAVSDPFHGPYYRLFALSHQTLLIPCLGKVYVVLAKHLPVWRAPSKEHIQEVSCWKRTANPSNNPRGDNSVQQPLNGQFKTHQREHSNGHVKSS